MRESCREKKRRGERKAESGRGRQIWGGSEQEGRGEAEGKDPGRNRRKKSKEKEEGREKLCREAKEEEV